MKGYFFVEGEASKDSDLKQILGELPIDAVPCNPDSKDRMRFRVEKYASHRTPEIVTGVPFYAIRCVNHPEIGGVLKYEVNGKLEGLLPIHNCASFDDNGRQWSCKVLQYKKRVFFFIANRDTREANKNKSIISS